MMKVVACSALIVAMSMLVWNAPAAQAGCGMCKPAAAAGKCAAPDSQPANKAACGAAGKCCKAADEGCCSKKAQAAEGGCSEATKVACHSAAATQPVAAADKSEGGCCPKAAKVAAGSGDKSAQGSVAAAQ